MFSPRLIVDNSLAFVKNFSRFAMKGLATHVYNSHVVSSATRAKEYEVIADMVRARYLVWYQLSAVQCSAMQCSPARSGFRPITDQGEGGADPGSVANACVFVRRFYFLENFRVIHV
jgi:hypothetical protein